MKTKLFIIFFFAALAMLVSAQTLKKHKPNTTAKPQTEQARIPGELIGETDNIVIPANVKAGTAFEVTIKTGGSGCSSQDSTSVVLGENSADIFVYDLTSATKPGTMCTMIFKQFDHKARLTFANKGEAVIRVWARTSGDAPMGKPVVIEKTITIK